MDLNLVMSKTNNEGKIAEQSIREELSRMLESPIFAQSERLGRFLRFTVETTLAGNGEALKEYLIGTEVYDRKPPYHPSADSIVRSEARRLRSKLKQYYESVGKDDTVFIYYRPGSYVPVFRTQSSQDQNCDAKKRALGEFLSEQLVAQALDLPSTAGNFEVQIIFEGTVRVVGPRAASLAPKSFRSGQNFSPKNQIRRVISMSFKKSAQG